MGLLRVCSWWIIFAAHLIINGPTDGALVRGVCRLGYFQCASDTNCISQGEYCNGKNNCLDASDEKDCDDPYYDDYINHLLRKNPGAENDDLPRNGCVFSKFPAICVCRNAELFCGHKNLLKIPRDLPTNQTIALLDFQGNNFPVVMATDMVANIPDTVIKLRFSHCNIHNIQGVAFSNLDTLYALYLDNNKLETISGGFFSEFNMLDSLYLKHNLLSKIAPESFDNLTNLHILDMSGNKMTSIDTRLLQPLQNMTELHLQGNQLKIISTGCFPELTSLQVLSLNDNKIRTLDPQAFVQLTNLRRLYLSGNKLELLKNGTFDGLLQLEFLKLDGNRIQIIEIAVFEDTPKLRSLFLGQNQLRMLSKRIFEPLTILDKISFDRFEQCENALNVLNCEPKGDGISNHGHLLGNPVLRTCVWIMGAVGCTGNLVVLLGRFLAPTTNNVVHSLYLKNLAFSDLLMGVYLFTIAAMDIQYSGVYWKHQYTWRHSYLCKLCGFLSTLSCESSVFILSLVTWDRFVSVTQPLARKQPSARTASLTLTLLWSFAVAVSTAPLAGGYFGDEFYGNNGVCLALHIHDPYATGWLYSAAMFMFVNAIALTFICFAYTRMISEIKASGVACRSTRQSQERDKVAQRFAVIVFTDCLCWVPIIIVKLVALSGLPIPLDLYGWLAIFILPINSALNPVLYTLTTTFFKKQLRKILNSCVCKKKRQMEPHSGSESGFSLSLGVFPIGGSTRRILSYRGTHSSSLNSANHTRKSSWKRPPTVV